MYLISEQKFGDDPKCFIESAIRRRLKNDWFGISGRPQG